MVDALPDSSQELQQQDDVAAVASYRSVSQAAVLSLLCGLVSPLAAFSILLVVLPLVGCGAALVACRRIAAPGSQLVGRPLALTGLTLSVLSGVAVVSYSWVLPRMLAAQARPWAAEWCDLVMAGQMHVALELTKPLPMRQPLDQLLAASTDKELEIEPELEEFRKHPLIQQLAQLPEGSRVQPVRLVGYDRLASGNPVLTVEYEVVLPAEFVSRHPLRFRLTLAKSGPGDRIAGGWQVWRYQLVPAE